MRIFPSRLDGALIIEPRVFGDARGFFMESWNARRYREAGIDEQFVQDNVSRSVRGVLRGLHVQHPQGQGKLVQVLTGEVFDVAVDIRRGSPTYGQWEGVTLSEENRRQFYIPPGFAHGFCVLSDSALFSYKCTEFYAPENEVSIRWDDPDIGIEWPVDSPILSAKDLAAIRLCDLPAERQPVYVPR
ncbi:MAG: dTDP-4-dehydrorhamnose 3,5-epimerase [Rhodocyclaceae bacterium]|nr:dTDP-4-dehydrorhamnose 3,5-epimerase [Rhodocyclaceae bacterium]